MGRRVVMCAPTGRAAQRLAEIATAGNRPIRLNLTYYRSEPDLLSAQVSACIEHLVPGAPTAVTTGSSTGTATPRC